MLLTSHVLLRKLWLSHTPENHNEQSISLILLIHFTFTLFLFDNSYIIAYIVTDNLFGLSFSINFDQNEIILV